MDKAYIIENQELDTFKRTIEAIRKKHAESIKIIQKKINEAADNQKFWVFIAKDTIPTIKEDGKYLSRYFASMGYRTEFSIMSDSQETLRIYWI